MKHDLRPLKLPLGTANIPLRVVGDAGIASGKSDGGRIVPVIILDTSGHPEVAEVIRVHVHFSAGDVNMQWAGGAGAVYLILNFIRPIETTALIAFDLETQWSLVDQIVKVRSVFIQAGRPGDRFIDNVNLPKVRIDIPDLGFKDDWERLLMRQLVANVRKRGVSRWDAKRVAKDVLKEWRDTMSFRMLPE